jgi:outer membrane immunogenic protein
MPFSNGNFVASGDRHEEAGNRSAIALIGTPAFAADMAVKAPPPPPAPVYSWTGWYVGGNVGYSWGNANTDIASNATIISSANLPGFGFTNPPVTFADSATQRLQGIIGGGQIGYNYQISPQWVLGFETDIQASGERGSNTFTTPFSGQACVAVNLESPPSCNLEFGGFAPVNGTAVTSYEAKIDWFGTVRGRLGVLLNDGLLLYGTGGLAYGRVGVSGNFNVNAAAPFFVFGPSTSTFSQSKTNIGFAAGGGLEGRLSPWLPPNWTWKLEYLYIDLGSLDTSTSFAVASNNPFFSPLTGTLTAHTHFTDNIVRVGLNYQFH